MPGAILNRTYGRYKNLYISFFRLQYLSLFTIAPRNIYCAKTVPDPCLLSCPIPCEVDGTRPYSATHFPSTASPNFQFCLVFYDLLYRFLFFPALCLCPLSLSLVSVFGRPAGRMTYCRSARFRFSSFSLPSSCLVFLVLALLCRPSLTFCFVLRLLVHQLRSS